jgi:hypothetical protein
MTDHQLELNPRLWKPDHQRALLLALLIGFAIGAYIGVHEVHPSRHYISWVEVNPEPLSVSWYSRIHGFSTYWLWVSLWGLGGSAIAAGLIYIVRLLKAEAPPQ